VTLTPHPLLVPRSRNSRAIPLLPLWAVRPVQSLSACTRVHFTFTLPKLYDDPPSFKLSLRDDYGSPTFVVITEGSVFQLSIDGVHILLRLAAVDIFHVFQYTRN